MEYYSDTNRPPEQFTNPGRELEPIYRERIDKDGNKYLKVVGQTNIVEKIQASKDSCDIKKIIEKYDIDLSKNITQIQNEYEDFTEFPTDVHDMQEAILIAKETFKHSSKHIREYYGNNFNKFVNAIGTGSIMADMEEIAKKQNVKIKPKIEPVTEPVAPQPVAPQPVAPQPVAPQNTGVNLNE